MYKIIALSFFILLNFSEYSYSKDEYFRTLRNNKVNLRQGPSFEYPIKLIYTLDHEDAKAKFYLAPKINDD